MCGASSSASSFVGLRPFGHCGTGFLSVGAGDSGGLRMSSCQQYDYGHGLEYVTSSYPQARALDLLILRFL